MDEILDQQLQRVETALNTLLDSIVTYNPSTTAADNLLQADDDLGRGLEQLTQHQANYTRILQLRHESALLDAKIKSSVQVLADVRKELLAIPLSTDGDTAQPVPYKDLLAYAKNIAPFTVPPSLRYRLDSAAASKPATQDAAAVTDPMDTSNSTTVPTTTPAPTENADGTAPTAPIDAERTMNTLSDEHKEWVSNLNNLPFQPWPGEEQMAMGALSALNYQVMHGNDPTFVDVERIQDEEKAAAERKEREEWDARRRAERAAGAGGRLQAAPAAEKPKAVFGFGDDEDEDDY